MGIIGLRFSLPGNGWHGNSTQGLWVVVVREFQRGAKGGPGPSNFCNKKKCVFNKRTIMVCEGILGPRLKTYLTVSSFLCWSGSNAWGESRALVDSRASSKSTSRVRDRGKGCAWGNGIEKYFSDYYCSKSRCTRPRWKILPVLAVCIY